MKLTTLVGTLILMASLSAQAHRNYGLSTAQVGAATIRAVIINLILQASTHLTYQINKEQLEVVRGDALDFLAGDEATEFLMMSMSELRSQEVGLQDLDDESIAQLIIESLE